MTCFLGGWLVREMTGETKSAAEERCEGKALPALAAQRGTAELGASIKTLLLERELPAPTDSTSVQENGESKRMGEATLLTAFPLHVGCVCVSLFALVKKPPRLIFGSVPLNLAFNEGIWSSFLMLFFLALLSYS